MAEGWIQIIFILAIVLVLTCAGMGFTAYSQLPNDPAIKYTKLLLLLGAVLCIASAIGIGIMYYMALRPDSDPGTTTITLLFLAALGPLAAAATLNFILGSRLDSKYKTSKALTLASASISLLVLLVTIIGSGILIYTADPTTTSY